MSANVALIVEAQRRAQGLPERIEDPAALAHMARLLAEPAAPPKRGAA